MSEYCGVGKKWKIKSTEWFCFCHQLASITANQKVRNEWRAAFACWLAWLDLSAWLASIIFRLSALHQQHCCNATPIAEVGIRMVMSPTYQPTHPNNKLCHHSRAVGRLFASTTLLPIYWVNGAIYVCWATSGSIPCPWSIADEMSLVELN